MIANKPFFTIGATLMLFTGCSEPPSGKGTRTDFFSVCPNGTRKLDGHPLGPVVVPDCSYEGALACESFEFPLPKHLGIANADGIALQTCLATDDDSAIARRGGESASVRVPLPVVDSGRLHIRANYYIPTDVELPERASLFAIRPAALYDVRQISLRIHQDRSLSFYTGAAINLGRSPPGSFELGDWQCVEGSFEIGSAGAILASVNNKVVLSEDAVMAPSDSYTVAAAFGGVTNPTDTFEIVLDSLVVATAPIGCE